MTHKLADGISFAAVVDELNVTYRMADYWIRENTITLAEQSMRPGSGYPRMITPDEAEALRQFVAEVGAARDMWKHLMSGKRWAELINKETTA